MDIETVTIHTGLLRVKGKTINRRDTHKMVAFAYEKHLSCFDSALDLLLAFPFDDEEHEYSWQIEEIEKDCPRFKFHFGDNEKNKQFQKNLLSQKNRYEV